MGQSRYRLSFIVEEEGQKPQAERARSHSPPPVVTARSRRGSTAEPDAERTPTSHPSRAELLDDLPACVNSRCGERRLEEEANVSIRKKFIGF